MCGKCQKKNQNDAKMLFQDDDDDESKKDDREHEKEESVGGCCAVGCGSFIFVCGSIGLFYEKVATRVSELA